MECKFFDILTINIRCFEITVIPNPKSKHRVVPAENDERVLELFSFTCLVCSKCLLTLYYDLKISQISIIIEYL
ncbi:Hypothetical predicted protein [Octopus vulgaris]|uniref:Uncharacterized protein n=1 Tax=Octopus vulgaris TaxID=6645 RepID=A0AA36AM97_OCTVU|nr:Hypothetical predicted protein [Octopus vulgaris]